MQIQDTLLEKAIQDPDRSEEGNLPNPHPLVKLHGALRLGTEHRAVLTAAKAMLRTPVSISPREKISTSSKVMAPGSHVTMRRDHVSYRRGTGDPSKSDRTPDLTTIVLRHSGARCVSCSTN